MAWRENLNVNQLSLGNESINQSDGPQGVAFTIGAEAANVINVGMVFQDVNGAAMTVPGALKHLGLCPAESSNAHNQRVLLLS